MPSLILSTSTRTRMAVLVITLASTLQSAAQCFQFVAAGPTPDSEIDHANGTQSNDTEATESPTQAPVAQDLPTTESPEPEPVPGNGRSTEESIALGVSLGVVMFLFIMGLSLISVNREANEHEKQELARKTRTDNGHTNIGNSEGQDAGTVAQA